MYIHIMESAPYGDYRHPCRRIEVVVNISSSPPECTRGTADSKIWWDSGCHESAADIKEARRYALEEVRKLLDRGYDLGHGVDTCRALWLGGHDPRAEVRAEDAHLVAAAPDLYRAAMTALSYVIGIDCRGETQRLLMAVLAAAIAKAKGRS